MHQPVMLREALELLGVKSGGIYVDGTVGGGGHAEAILRASAPDGVLVGLDRDADALARTSIRLQEWKDRCRLVHANYRNMAKVIADLGLGKVSGVLLDLGISSNQLDEPLRGFSFMYEGPLDMRMDATTQGATAADLVNGLSEEDICALLREKGEERKARQIARAIAREREKGKITSTTQLAAIIEKAAGGRRGKIHPATRSFQALRIAVNDEFEGIAEGLEGSMEVMAPGGRLAVISFHSLEDRIVKRYMVEHVGRWESLAAGGEKWVGAMPKARWVAKKHVVASDDEVQTNPRSRSAKLRVIEKILEQ